MTPEATRSRLEALHPDCWGWALACCGRDAEAAREVLQMTYLKVLDGSARWGGEASFKTWLFGVIRNTAAERRRTAWLRALTLDRLLARPPAREAPRDPEREASASESAALVRAALERLSARQREVLHLVFYQSLTLDEAARVLGISPGTARLHYDRGKSRLRELLPAGVRA